MAFIVKEVIRHAAVKSPSGMIFLGKSHADCFYQAAKVGIETTGAAEDQGFFTNKGRFVNRSEAAVIARYYMGQSNVTTVLCSEDLWSSQHGGLYSYDSVEGYVKR